MQQQRKQQHQSQRIFTATDVAQYEYCPLVWWYEQYEPLSEADNEELFAHLVELEYEHGSQAPALPEYQVTEQLLVRRGAFEEGRQQHLDHAEQVAEEERVSVPSLRSKTRTLMFVALAIMAIALLLMLAPLLLH